MRHLTFLVLTLLAAATLRAETPVSAPLPPTEAARRMTLPPGFSATLFAGEPDVVQPIATAMDDRGRLWVAECLSYPQWQTDPTQGHDRILIFEDQNADGHFSKKTLFADNISNLTGLEIGFGGVWVCSAPNLLFIPVDPTGDKPAGKPIVMLDGWDIKTAQHNIFNRLTWGPDGWLYGLNGIQAKSLVGAPGTPDEQRTPMNCGVWRFHPVRHIFERVAQGTTNPWGLDFDDYGQMFITNCVIEHIFHIIPGGHYKRMYGEDFDPHAYSLMQTCADHIHWAGGAWQSSRGGEGAHGTAGGGHAHAGCMIYLGDNWPDEYRNNAFMCNIHGNRINRDLLEQKGSGYVAHHGLDFLLANDTWFRGLNLIYGPDGGVFIQDWCDTGECHNHVVVDRSNGRIFKVVYGKVKPAKVDLASMSDDELVKLQLHKNDWYVRHARRILQERAVAGKLAAGTIPALKAMLNDHPDVTRKLRALWALYSVGNRDAAVIAAASDEPQVRAWGIRLLADSEPSAPEMSDLLARAAGSDSPVVRLALASALQRLPYDDRGPALLQLVGRAEDARDPNLPLMIWYAAEPLTERITATEYDGRVGNVGIPLIREYAARALAEKDLEEAITALRMLATPTNDTGTEADNRRAAVVDVLRGIQAAVKDRQHLEKPKEWAAVVTMLSKHANAEVRQRALLLSLKFGTADAVASVRKIITDAKLNRDDRRLALLELSQANPPGLGAFLQELMSDPALGDMAIRSMATAADPGTAKLLIDRYPSLSTDNKRFAITTLSSRKEWALAMLQAVDEGKLPRADLDSLAARQLSHLKDPAIDARVKTMWGSSRPIAQEKAALMIKYRAELAPAALKKADLSNGRRVFNNTCAACHTMFDAGGKVGPNLTGSQRANLDYLLENTLDPSAVVAKEYLLTVVHTNDGRVISGIIEADNRDALILKMPGDNVTIPKTDIKSRQTEAVSMMPEGLLQSLSTEDRRDLVGYMASPNQVDLPKP